MAESYSRRKVSPTDVEVTPNQPDMSQRRIWRKSSAWQRLKKRWRHKGVVEIGDDHPAFPMLSCLRQGLSELLTSYPHLGPKDELTDEDYDHVLEKHLSVNGKTYTFSSYASSVFATIRHAIDVQEPQYQKSLAPLEALPFLEFISNSRSGQDFYLSTDMQYFIKTDSKKPVEFFRSILRNYLQHFHKYPHSLLVKYLGLYSVEGPRFKKKYVLVMQSVFFPADRIETKFDVKGCFAGRFEQPFPPDAIHIPVLKDQNFWNETLELGSERDWFLKQIEVDSEFLSSHGVIDYSLLIGTQPLRMDERGESISNLVLRVRKSLYDPTSPQNMAIKSLANVIKVSEAEVNNPAEKTRSSPQRHNPNNNHDVSSIPDSKLDAKPSGDDWEHIEEISESSKAQTPSNSKVLRKAIKGTAENGSEGFHESSYSKDKAWNESGDGPSQGNSILNTLDKPYMSFTDNSYLNKLCDSSNRRLLPNCKNALHIVDGPNNRYFLGIIDFLTEYGLYQKLDGLRKNIKYGCGDHSTIPPTQYASRFQRFFSQHIS